MYGWAKFIWDPKDNSPQKINWSQDESQKCLPYDYLPVGNTVTEEGILS